MTDYTTQEIQDKKRNEYWLRELEIAIWGSRYTGNARDSAKVVLPTLLRAIDIKACSKCT